MIFEQYFCTNCRKELKEAEELFFVEEILGRHFCGESCIEEFYAPLVKGFEKSEAEIRNDFGLQNETCRMMTREPSVMEELLAKPDEIWLYENDIEQKFYTFIKEMGLSGAKKETGSLYCISICFVFQKRPSFVILCSSTRSESFVESFKKGKKIEKPQSFLEKEDEQVEQEISLDKDVLQAAQQKKSSFLAELLDHRSSNDIAYESFSLYDEFMNPTLEEPDEIYRKTDNEGDKILTYIKAHTRSGVSFFYFVLCLRLENVPEEGSYGILPFLSFPSVDGDLATQLKRGECISGNLKN